METPTHLSETLQTAGLNAQYDAEAKAILSDKIILSWILKYTTKEFKDCTIDFIKNCIDGEPQISAIQVYPGNTRLDIVNGLNTESKIPHEGKVTFDILFYVTLPCNDERVKFYVNVEAQKASNPGYNLVARGIFYCSRILSSELDKDFTTQSYDQIKKVYSIWICMNSPKEAENTITDYSIKPTNIFGNYQGKAIYDLLSVVMVCLPSIANADKGNALHKLLSTILSSELSYEKKIHTLQQDFNISVTQEMEGKLVNMCNLSQAIEEKNLEIGIQKGIEKGIQKGMQKGMQKGIKKGENDLIFVLKSLKEMGRNEDADAILFDENRRKEIYEEFGIS